VLHPRKARHVIELFCQIGQANVLVAFSMRYDAVIEGHAGLPASELMHFETRRSFVRHVQTFAVAFRSQEDVVLDAGVDGTAEGGVERYCGRPRCQPTGTEILKPILGRSHAIQRRLTAVRVGRNRDAAGTKKPTPRVSRTGLKGPPLVSPFVRKSVEYPLGLLFSAKTP
jgi:hypothetical protein